MTHSYWVKFDSLGTAAARCLMTWLIRDSWLRRVTLILNETWLIYVRTITAAARCLQTWLICVPWLNRDSWLHRITLISNETWLIRVSQLTRDSWLRRVTLILDETCLIRDSWLIRDSCLIRDSWLIRDACLIRASCLIRDLWLRRDTFILNKARSYWIRRVHTWMSHVCKQCAVVALILNKDMNEPYSIIPRTQWVIHMSRTQQALYIHIEYERALFNMNVSRRSHKFIGLSTTTAQFIGLSTTTAHGCWSHLWVCFHMWMGPDSFMSDEWAPTQRCVCRHDSYVNGT